MATDVVVLWHMHQPRYIDPGTGQPALPWVRLHAASGYLDMARALERHPGARVTVNFVPSLVEQLELLAAGAQDPLERLAASDAAELGQSERETVVARCFSAHFGRQIAPRPRFAELASKRAQGWSAFTPQDLADAQCLFMLAWLGPAARALTPEIEVLEARGTGFALEDQRLLAAAIRRAALAVLPAWRHLADRGQVELIASPFHHPIVPLLCDSDVARVARPGARLPPRFAHPDDALLQIRRGLAAHARAFGRPPAGMWPPEGSVSPAALAAYATAGVRWLVADEGVLERSLDEGERGALAGRPPRSAVWRHGEVDLLFRDRELSDRIGFRYADVGAEEAASDLLGAARARSGGGLCVIALDGENAWEAYPGRGAPFLDALYRRLAAPQGGLRSRTVSEVVDQAKARPLARLHPGSWIDASFHIWIGDPVKNRGWTLLGKAKQRLAEAMAAPAADPVRLSTAQDHLLAAEASDWFWWFGEPFSSAEDALFDALFRAQLAAVYTALGDHPPAALDEPVDDRRGSPMQLVPTALISPRLDGRAGFYEWKGAARHDLQAGGTMADRSQALEGLLVGFDLEHLYLCLEPARHARRRVGAAHLKLSLSTPHASHRLTILLGAADGGEHLVALDGKVAAGDVVELQLPLSRLGARQGDELRLAAVLEFAGHRFACLPGHGELRVTVPGADLGADDWHV
jgi:alpha-amylase/alpha-mannosidase (GH57 family)